MRGTIEKLRIYFESLERLSGDELDLAAKKLVQAEVRNTALLIAHLSEMSRRKTALERGYRNLFDYCVRRLNLSEGSVALRLQVANVARRFPELLVALAENRISLTVAGMLAPHLDEENVETLLADCAGMTKRAVEEYLVRLWPKPAFESSIRRQPAPASPPERVEKAPQESPEPPPTKLDARTPITPRPTPPVLAPATPERFNFRFSADRKFKEKLERLAEVLGVENLEKHLAEVLEKAVDVALERKDPKRRREQRLEKESRPDEISKKTAAPSRYIPQAVRERVHERAGYRCEYRSRDGTRCTSRTGLQIEHEKPFAIFRSHDERYLRLLCARHNRLRAEQVYGTRFVQRKIDAARRGTSGARIDGVRLQ